MVQQYEKLGIALDKGWYVVDGCAAEHIMMDALIALNKKCRDVAFECNKQIDHILKED